MKRITKINEIPYVTVVNYDVLGHVSVELSNGDSHYVENLFKFMKKHCPDRCSFDARYIDHDAIIGYANFSISHQPIVYFITIELYDDIAIERFLAYHVLYGHI